MTGTVDGGSGCRDVSCICQLVDRNVGGHAFDVTGIWRGATSATVTVHVKSIVQMREHAMRHAIFVLLLHLPS